MHNRLMRVLIAADIEGVTGVVSWSQCEGPGGAYDWTFARRMMVHDVNAAIRGARAAGATEVVVKDSHNLCKNLLVDDLEPGTGLISGIMDGDMMAGVEEGFDAAVLVGYHAMAGTERGIMEHALAGGLHRFWVNGLECGEIYVSAAFAGAHGVPLVAVTSDRAGCEEAEVQIPGVRTACTKHGIGRFMGRLLPPEATATAIEDAVREGVAARAEVAPIRLEGEVTMRCEFHHLQEADLAALLEGSVRVDGYTVEWTRPTYQAAYRAMYIAFNLGSAGRKSGD
jgi:D-amino peptidase